VASAKSGPIVVGVDGSEHSRRALQWAAEEAAQRGATLEVVLAWTLLAQPGTKPPKPDFTDTDARAVLEQIVDEALGADRPEGMVLSPINDLAARALIDASEEASLVVVGSRGLGGFRDLLLGSVSGQVVRHAKCPVVVIPGSERHR
jgi:nucleotide-binding universal stress UspA family protein